MEFYLIFLAVVIVFAVSSSLDKNLRIVSLYLLFILITFLVSFRYNIGTDYHNYANIYYHLKNGNDFNIEIGYKYVNLLFIKLGLSYQFSVFFFSILTNLFMFFFIKKYSISPMFSLVLYIFMTYYFMTYNIVRQMCAISIFLLGLDLIFQKKYLRFIIVTCFAALFHYSLLLGLIYPIFKINKFKLFFTIWVISLPFIFLPVQNIIIKILPDSFYYAYYFSSEFFMKTSSVSIFRLFVPNLLVIVLLYTFLKFSNIKDMFWANLFIFSIAILNMANGVSVLMRLSYCFQISEIIFYPLLISKISKQERALHFVLLCGYSILFYIVTIIIREGQGVVPYQSFLFL